MLEILSAVIILELVGIIIIGIMALNVLFKIEKKIDTKRQVEPIVQMVESRVNREVQVNKPEPEAVKHDDGIVICRKCYASFSASNRQCPNCGTIRMMEHRE